MTIKVSFFKTNFLLRYALLGLIAMLVLSCGSSKKAQAQQASIITAATSYLGTPYAYGGTTKRGIDCSGLVINSFGAQSIQLPRSTQDQIKEGKKARLKSLRKGDLVFFSTSKPKRKVNHVGIVVETSPAVKFIHSSSSKGVMISSMKEAYWRKNYKKARRILM